MLNLLKERREKGIVSSCGSLESVKIVRRLKTTVLGDGSGMIHFEGKKNINRYAEAQPSPQRYTLAQYSRAVLRLLREEGSCADVWIMEHFVKHYTTRKGFVEDKE